ncbi:MAG: [NiFe]-hydrogenase assembly chaperone HybE [Pseudomonadota bacterium]
MSAALPLPVATLNQKIASLVAAFRVVGATRMQGVPVLHPGLSVEAVAFDIVADADESAALGILLTPWFMNLVWLPLQEQAPLPVGQTVVRRLGVTDFEFIGAHEPGFGAYEMCSLFSPMFEFADQAAARETAQQALELLRTAPKPKPAAPLHGRRAFLFGRPRETV